MAVKHQGPEHVTAAVNVPMPRELAVQVKDTNGKPVKDNWVTWTAKPSDSFEFAGGTLYAVLKTDERGIAAIRGTPRTVQQLRINAEAADGLGNANFTVDVTDCDGTEVHRAGDDILVIDGGGTRPTTHVPLWPIAAMVIAALVIGGALLLFGRDDGGKTSPPIVVRPGPSSTVDSTARAEAQAARAAVDQTAAELRGELDSGLAANSAHDRGYGREYGRPTLRLALENARRIAANRHGDEPSAGWKPPICRSDPDLPACRE